MRCIISHSGPSEIIEGEQAEDSNRGRVDARLSAKWTVVQILRLDEWEAVTDRYI